MDRLGARAVLCYARPWNHSQFLHLAQQLSPGTPITVCSEHKRIDSSGLTHNYYTFLKKNIKEVESIVQLPTSEKNEVIARCRLLRQLSHARADVHVTAMAAAVELLLTKLNPSFVLSVTVDNFVIDLLRLLSEKKKILFVGLVPSFVNGHFRITAIGEVTHNPKPNLDNLEEVREELLQVEYTPTFAAAALASPTRAVWARWFRNAARIPYFLAKRLCSGDPYNYHTWISQLTAAERARPWPPRDPGKDDWVEKIKNDNRLCVYIPLQKFPECTVDYWCKCLSVINYYETLERFINNHCRSVHIVVKEHPGVFGDRPRGFYRKLARDPRITVIPTHIRSNYIIEQVDSVLVWTGSVGFEAALRGKAVFTMCEPYYKSGMRFYSDRGSASSEQLIEHVQKCKRHKVSEAEQRELVGELLRQLFTGRFKNDGTWRSSNPSDVKDIEGVSDSIRTYITEYLSDNLDKAQSK